MAEHRKNINIKKIRQYLDHQDPIDKQILLLMNNNKLNVDIIPLDKPIS